MIKRVLAVAVTLLVMVFSSARAEIVVKYDEILSAREQILSAQEVGLEMPKKYNFNSTDDLRACVTENGHIRDELKQLRARIKDLNSFSYRLNLTYAADEAFVCVYCGGRDSAKSCAQVSKDMAKVDADLSAAAKLPN
jgi:hypothetical protein